MINDLQDTPKDTSKSCVFDFPDRPVRPIPPVDGNGDPIPTYPYEPILDWPLIPANPPVPGIDPIPKIDPHPVFPIISPTPTFGQAFSYFYNQQGTLNPADSTLFFGSLADHLDIDMGPTTGGIQFGHVATLQRNAAHDALAAQFQAETGLSLDSPSVGNNYETRSGLHVTWADRGAGKWLIYFAYFADLFEGVSGMYLITFGPVSIVGVQSLPNFIIKNDAGISYPPGTYSDFGTPPAILATSHNFNTACVYIGTDITPFSINIG